MYSNEMYSVCEILYDNTPLTNGVRRDKPVLNVRVAVDEFVDFVD